MTNEVLNNEALFKIIKSPAGKAEYGTMLVYLHRCAACQSVMVKPYSSHGTYTTFPRFIDLCFDEQLKHAGWQAMSGVSVDAGPICKHCVEQGQAVFTCALCKDERHTSQVQESFGDPAEHLCSTCYVLTPAKTWCEKASELFEKHQYDST